MINIRCLRLKTSVMTLWRVVCTVVAIITRAAVYCRKCLEITKFCKKHHEAQKWYYNYWLTMFETCKNTKYYDRLNISFRVTPPETFLFVLWKGYVSCRSASCGRHRADIRIWKLPSFTERNKFLQWVVSVITDAKRGWITLSYSCH